MNLTYEDRLNMLLNAIETLNLDEKSKSFLIDCCTGRRKIKEAEFIFDSNKRRLVAQAEILKKRFINDFKDIVSNVNFKDASESFNKASRKFFAGEFHEIFGVLCCTRNENSPLMWAHYADSHRGVVVEIDDDNFYKEHPNKLLGRVIDVEYVSKRPVFKLGLEDDFGASEKFFFKKSIDWEYEKECRLVWPMKYADSVSEEGVRLISVPKAAVKRIIFGCNYDANEIARVCELARDRWGELIIMKAKISHETFSIEYETILFD